MRVRNQTGTFWPSALQERLLVTALEDKPDVAVAAWREIRPHLSLDELEPGSFELLPLVYRNLTLAGYDEPELPRLAGIYRRTWVRNNLLAERTAESCAVLAAAGIPALFIEGVTLASRFYRELGLRPTSSIDVLVEDVDAKVALAQLARAGWAVSGGSAAFRYLSDGNGNVCALRTRLAIDYLRPAVGTRSHALFLDTDERHSVRGVDIHVPPPAETLFAVCVAHARVEQARNMQWIADAKMILRAEIDWRRLLAITDESGQGSRLRAALDYLAGLPGPEPPQEVRDRLASAKITKREHLSYVCTVRSIQGTGTLPSLVAAHLAATAHRSFFATIASFPGFLRDHWDLAHTWQVPLAAGRRAVRTLGSRREAT